MGRLALRYPRRLPDGYTDKLAEIAQDVADLDPWNLGPAIYTAHRDSIIMKLAKVAAEYG